MFTDGPVIVGQPRAQPPGFGANDRIASGIEIVLLVEDLQTDKILLDLIALADERLLYSEFQKPAVARSVAEDRRLQDFL